MPTSQQTILLIDENDTRRSVVAQLLEDNQLQVLRAKDRVDALAIFSQTAPDLVVLGFAETLPVSEVIVERIREFGGIPVLAMSSEAPDSQPIEADEYVVIPFEPGDFLIRVGVLLRELASNPA